MEETTTGFTTANGQLRKEIEGKQTKDDLDVEAELSFGRGQGPQSKYLSPRSSVFETTGCVSADSLSEQYTPARGHEGYRPRLWRVLLAAE